MSSPTSSYLVIPPKWLKEPLPTREVASGVVPQIIKVVEALWGWYHAAYPTADEDERSGRETSLRKIIVSLVKILQVDRS